MVFSVRAISRELSDELRRVEDCADKVQTKEKVQRNCNPCWRCERMTPRHMREGLKMVNGLQAWQALLRAKSQRDPMGLMNQLPNPRVTSIVPRLKMRQCKINKNVTDHIRNHLYHNNGAFGHAMTLDVEPTEIGHR